MITKLKKKIHYILSFFASPQYLTGAAALAPAKHERDIYQVNSTSMIMKKREIKQLPVWHHSIPKHLTGHLNYRSKICKIMISCNTKTFCKSTLCQMWKIYFQIIQINLRHLIVWQKISSIHDAFDKMVNLNDFDLFIFRMKIPVIVASIVVGW